MSTTHQALLFSDPNCPFCYAMEERLHATGLAGRVAWCGVQHAPELPVPMRPAAGALAHELPAEVAAIARLAPEVAIASPPGKPNTRAAIEHAAAALHADPVAGRDFVRALYRAFWTAGVDLSDAAALTRLAEDAGLRGLQVDATARGDADGWQRQWQQSGLAGVPALIRDDGQVLYGLHTEADLRGFLS